MFEIGTAKKTINGVKSVVDVVRSGFKAGREALFNSKGKGFAERIAIFRETYQKEMEALEAKRKDKTEDTEEKLDAADEKVENSLAIPEEEYEFEDADDEPAEVKRSFGFFQNALKRNMEVDDDKDLEKALQKLKNQPDSEPEEGHDKALTAEEMAAFGGAGLRTWLDLMYDKNGDRLAPKQFAHNMKRLFEAKGDMKSLLKKYVAKNFQYAFTKLEDGTKLDVLQSAGVDTGVGTEIFGGDDAPGARISAAIKELKSGGDIDSAAKTFQKYFFPHTSVEKLAPVLLKVKKMIGGDLKSHDLAFVLYNINPSDLKKLAKNLKRDWSGKGVVETKKSE